MLLNIKSQHIHNFFKYKTSKSYNYNFAFRYDFHIYMKKNVQNS